MSKRSCAVAKSTVGAILRMARLNCGNLHIKMIEVHYEQENFGGVFFSERRNYKSRLETGSGMERTNDKLKPSCSGAILLNGKLLNGEVSEGTLKKWVEDLNL